MQLKILEKDLILQLKRECLGMAAAYQEALLTTLPPSSVDGIYIKGSSEKEWDSEIDYVPELSDVDLHVRLAEDENLNEIDLTLALTVARRAMAHYRQQFASPVHVPKPQLMFLNELEKMPGYLSSPVGQARTLMGRPYKASDRAAYKQTVSADIERFCVDADFVLNELVEKVIDRPGRQLWHVVSRINWRVGPAGPRLLTQLGMDPFDAWSLNRTGVVYALQARGLDAVANAYVSYYQAGWRGFLTGFEQEDEAEQALEAARNVFAEASAVL